MNYKEAIERIKARFNKWALDDEDLDAIKTLVPELKEDEDDERIRIGLINYFKERDSYRDDDETFYGMEYPDIISYLEKQKKQSTTSKDLDEEIHRFFEDCIVVHEAKLYGSISERVIPVDNYELTARHFAKWSEKQKEKKAIEDVIKNITKNKEAATKFLKLAGIMDENGELAEMYRSEQEPAEMDNEETELSDFESELFSAFSDGWQQYLHGEEVNVAQWAKEHSAQLLNAAKQELKLVDWGEEEQNLNVCLSYINDETLRQWLKDAIHTKRNKQEWSEEDDKMLKSIIEDSQNCHILGVDQIDWIKSLRPQSHKWYIKKGHWYMCIVDKPEYGWTKGKVYQSPEDNRIETNYKGSLTNWPDKEPWFRPATRSEIPDNQPHWKPSKEQMEALYNAQRELCDTKYNEGLCSLIDEFQKL